MAVTEKLLRSSQTTVVSGSNLNALANNALVLSATFDNTIGATGDGYVFGQFELYAEFAGTPAANSSITCWFIQSPDGTNDEDGGTSVTPAKAPRVRFPLRNASGNQRITIDGVALPPGKFKMLVKNDGSGGALSSNTNSFIKLLPYTRQGV